MLWLGPCRVLLDPRYEEGPGFCVRASNIRIRLIGAAWPEASSWQRQSLPTEWFWT